MMHAFFDPTSSTSVLRILQPIIKPHQPLFSSRARTASSLVGRWAAAATPSAAMQQTRVCCGCQRPAPLPTAALQHHHHQQHHHRALPVAAAAGAAAAAAATTVPPPTAGHHHHQQLHSRPRSPSLSPRAPLPLEPSDPALVRQLRSLLARAASRPPGFTAELEQLLVAKLGATPQQLQRLSDSAQAAALQQQDSSSSSVPPHCLQSQQPLEELSRGLDQLLVLFSAAELLRLLEQTPALLHAPLASWCAFLDEFGFTPSQQKNLVSQTRGEVMTQGTLVTAGAAILHLKAAGAGNDEIRHRVVASYPQVLAMSPSDIDLLLRLWAKFKTGVDEEAASSC